MTREETTECIAVMQAYADGKEIEYKLKHAGNADWKLNTTPGWDWSEFSYRIKSQPMKVTEEERILLQIKGRIIKAKNSNYITIVNDGDVELLRNEFYFLNKETQEWEDWSQI